MLVIEGGELLLPDGARSAGDVGVENGRIVAVGAVGDLGSRPERLDARGCTVMPGLIDLHSHLTLVPEVHSGAKVSRSKVALLAARQARRALRAGITRCRDIGGYRHVDIDLRNAINDGVVPGPTMVCAGQFIAITGGHGSPYIREADGESEVRKAAREQIKAGADFIKLMGSGGLGHSGEVETAVQFTQSEVSAIVEEARAAGTVAAAHVHPEAAIRKAVQAGVRSVEHGSYLTAELAGMMVDQDIFLVPTFSIIRAMTTDPRWRDLAPRAQHMYDIKVNTFRSAVELGVRWGIGTDAGIFTPLSAIVDELEILKGLGFGATEVLSQVTRGNADLWGWPDVGRLEVGFAAELILVPGNPVEDLSTLREVQATIARGTVYDWRVLDDTPSGGVPRQ